MYPDSSIGFLYSGSSIQVLILKQHCSPVHDIGSCDSVHGKSRRNLLQIRLFGRDNDMAVEGPQLVVGAPWTEELIHVSGWQMAVQLWVRGTISRVWRRSRTGISASVISIQCWSACWSIRPRGWSASRWRTSGRTARFNLQWGAGQEVGNPVSAGLAMLGQRKFERGVLKYLRRL